MKKWLLRLLPIILICIVAAVTVPVGVVYFHFITQRIYEDSTDNLKEIYDQVNNSFEALVERNWQLLEDWDLYFSQEGFSENAVDYIESRKQTWGFSEFYFIKKDKNFLTAGGDIGKFELEGVWEEGRPLTPIMVGERESGGSESVIFAVPTAEEREYNGYRFDALGVSCTNADIAKALKADAFSGKAMSFIIREDGRVLLSTREGGTAFSNYLQYLDSTSDLSDEAIARMQADWKAGNTDTIRCKIGKDKTDYCIIYLPVDKFENYILLGIVPQSALSEGFLSVQRATTIALIVIFLILGGAMLALFLFRSIRQSRRNKTELAYRERMFDVLSSSVDDIFIMLDPTTQRVEYLSPNVERLLGIPCDEVRGNIRSMAKCAVDYNIIVPERELDEIPLNGNKYWECEYMHQSTGERRWYRVTIYSLNIQSVKKYIVVMSDRTLEQQMNQKLQEALDAAKSANEAKSNFLSNMSHDIRTPMNAIVGFSVLLEKDADQPEKVREYTHKIMASGHHLLSLINDVLDMSKIESGKTSLNVDKFSLPELLEELNIILMPQAKAKRQEFTIHVQGTPPEQMVGDKLRLNQILINLLSNAIKYTPVDGKIEFTVCELDPPSPQYSKLRFIVKDNGIGMSEEFQKQIFAPFSREINSVTNKIQGTGLGMAITKNLIDLMGGIITLESEPGKGSTFTVEMSFLLPEQEESDAWYRQKVTRMLVADDEEEICFNIREMMRDTGVDVSCVTDGASAVELAVQAHRRQHDFHVILLDWKMPGQDGVETARQIREKVGSDVPILVLTSYDWSEIEEEARAAGINAFMPKPFFASTFWQTIKPLFLGRAEETDAAAGQGEVMKGKLFLVAEDNELNAEILTELLDIEGAKCELATNGEEAVSLFERSEEGHFDMILMDVQMPIMNGYEATQRIRQSAHPQAKTIPIVAMTANTFAEDVRNAMDAGMDGHLAKPINMDAVRATVAELLGKKGAPAPQGGEEKQ